MTNEWTILKDETIQPVQNYRNWWKSFQEALLQSAQSKPKCGLKMCEECGFLIFLLHGQRPRYFFGRTLRERFQGLSKTSSLNYAQVRSSRACLSMAFKQLSKIMTTSTSGYQKPKDSTSFG